MVMEHCQRLRTRLEKSEAEKTSLSKELEKHRSNAGTGTPTVAKQNTGTRPKSLPLLSLLKSQSPATREFFLSQYDYVLVSFTGMT